MPEDVRPYIALTFQHLLRERDMTQDELAGAAGYAPSELSRLLTQQGALDQEAIARLGTALGVGPAALHQRVSELHAKSVSLGRYVPGTKPSAALQAVLDATRPPDG